MCGIAGYYSKSLRLGEQALISMRDVMVHRGPDDAGLFVAPNSNMAFVHRRLSILDLSPAGHQPMSEVYGRYWIVYNGEIYNYIELRKELEQKGYVFRSQTDTEVILMSFIEWGEACQNRFNGMWAFAIWDNQEDVLFLSRDRFGIKPLYYFWDGNTFIFASELKSLLKSGIVPPLPNYESLVEFVITGVIDGREDTCFQNVKRVPPSHSITLSKSVFTLRRYWQVIPQPIIIGESQAVKEFRNLLEDAIRISLRSDVPLGACLSGGLDSSSIVGMIYKITGNHTNTFSSYYNFANFDERYYIKKVVQATQAVDYYIEPPTTDFLSTAEKIVWHLEEPSKSTGVYSQWFVMELACPHVKVLLDGQGGDEVLAGYTYYRRYLLLSLLRSDPVLSLQAYQSMSKFGPPSLTRDLIFMALARWLRIPHVVRRLKRSTPYALRPDLYQSHAEQWRKRDPAVLFNSLNERLRYDVVYEMLPSMLKYEDKIGMAFSLESRVPLLDYRLVEFAFRLPETLKLHPSGWSKYILRRSIEGLLPDEIVWRRDKKGFPTAMSSLFKASWGQVRSRILDNFGIRSMFDISALDAQLERARHAPGGRLVWQRLTMALWFELFIDDSSFNGQNFL